MYPELKIVSGGGRRRGRWNQPKGRDFRGYVLGMVEADELWSLGGATSHRPVWMAYVASRGMARPLTANLRGGRLAEWGQGSSADDCLEFPKSAGHRWLSTENNGAIVTRAYLPEAFHLDPVLVASDRVTFISMPSRAWVTREAEKTRGSFGDDAEEVVKAALWCAYLDRRTALPIPNDLRFQLGLYRSALEHLAVKRQARSWSHRGFEFFGMDRCGLEEPVAMHAKHEDVEELMTAEVQKHFEEEVRHGQTRKRSRRGVLPGAGTPVVQLQLDFGAAVCA